mmetsp:Transcript_28377/g.61665  ORF Transcript_28377/g.61665 Transcript_28377/m.61665 type:complete len:101 (-) Transcript_28377:141-443(-)
MWSLAVPCCVSREGARKYEAAANPCNKPTITPFGALMEIYCTMAPSSASPSKEGQHSHFGDVGQSVDQEKCEQPGAGRRLPYRQSFNTSCAAAFVGRDDG